MEIATKHPAIGLPLVSLSLDPLTGNGKALDKSSLAGKVTLINLWGTWCPPCRIEFPHLAVLESKLKGENEFFFRFGFGSR